MSSSCGGSCGTDQQGSCGSGDARLAQQDIAITRSLGKIKNKILVMSGKGGVGKSTVAVNLAGLPGLSQPCGFAGGLPVGLQLIGDYFSEAKLLNAAHRYQQVTDWHLRQAPLAE